VLGGGYRCAGCRWGTRNHRTLVAVAGRKRTKAISKAKPLPKGKAVAKTAARTPGLDAVAAAISSGDGATALTAAITAWRAQRAPALADLVDAISARLSGPPITTDLEWTKTAAMRDPITLGGMLAGVTELPASFLPTVGQQLASFDDPRIASAARAWVLDPPTQSSSTYPFWTALIAHLIKLGDTRVLPAFAKRVKIKPGVAQGRAWSKKPSQFWGKFYKALDGAAEKIEELEVPAVDTAAIDKLVKQAAKLAPVVAKARPSAVDKGPALARALAQLSAGQVGAAIDAMLDAWRDKRATEVADLIDRATRLLPTYDLGFPVETKPGHAAWQEAFARDPSAEMPRLLQHVTAGGASMATEHVVALSALRDDPRIAFRLAEVASTTNISAQRPQFWKSVWELIARTRDTRVTAPLRRAFRDFESTYWDHHRSGKRLLAPLFDAQPATLDADDHKSCNQIAAALATLEAPGEQEQLIAQVVTSWADDGPRLVYADWLIEQGHPRGEAIVLGCKPSLSPAETKRQSAVLGGWTNETFIYGPFSDLKCERARGLPTTITIEWASSLTWRRVAAHPLLACIQAIQTSDSSDPRART
jgi:uncharacterized protein (TIGR02996 family)